MIVEIKVRDFLWPVLELLEVKYLVIRGIWSPSQIHSFRL